MAYGGRPSVNKRQKELARQEKRQEKEKRRARRQAERATGGGSNSDISDIVPGPQPPAPHEES